MANTVSATGDDELSLDVDEYSMMIGTDVLQDDDGTVYFDLYDPPYEYVPSTDDEIHTVTSNEAGSLDKIAFDYYENERLWWIIAIANRLLNPMNEVVAGVKLIVPSRTNVEAYLAKVT